MQVPQDEKVPIVGQRNEVLVVPLKLTNREIRQALLTIARQMMPQVTTDIGPRLNSLESSMNYML